MLTVTSQADLVTANFAVTEPASAFLKTGHIANTQSGGTFILALLIYVVYRRRRGATYAQILHVPARGTSTPQLTPTPMRETFSKQPIYHDLQYSIRSSRHESRASWPPRVRLSTKAKNGRAKHKRIQSGWRDPDAPATPTKDQVPGLPASDSTFFFDASPTIKPRTPEKAYVHTRSTSTLKAPSVTETPLSTVQTAHTLSPLSSPPLFEDNDARWSWTNSQAPSTPRLRPESRRLSLVSKYSAPRFRSVVSWARGQGERLQIEEEPPTPLLPQPTLQPVPANRRAFKDASPPDLSVKRFSSKPKGSKKGHTKATSSLGGLGGFFRSNSNSKSTSNLNSSTPAFFKPSNGSKSTGNLALTPGDLENGLSTTDIELKERWK